jgi:anaerobic selenocysteine-containing dehydrogenase
MERRNFFKIISTVSAGIAASSCGDKSDVLIPMLVSDREIVPGEEQWHPAVCGECAAGCGTIVRIMEGQRVIERGGQKFRQRVAAIKKIEGNPLDPVSGGSVCARGQAAVQSLYNPDRVQGPMRRKGSRGHADFTPATWDEAVTAIAQAIGKVKASDPAAIAFLTRPRPGTRSLTIQRFLASIGGPPPLSASPAALAIETKAAETVFGWKGVPRYDLAGARYALGIGADFLGGWASPVYYARQFGDFRQGRPGIRGKLVQAESRMSITACSADAWLPLRPGSEPHFTVAIMRLLLDSKLARNSDALPKAVIESVQSADVDALIRTCGVDERRIHRIVRELGESEAPLVIGGASVVHTNSLQAVIATHYLNAMLGNSVRPGGVFPPNPEPSEPPKFGDIASAISKARVVFLDRENPVYTQPAATGIAQALSRADLVVSFGDFIDDSSAYADWILPDHHNLESATAVVPAVSPRPAVTVSTPFVQPLYDTRALEQTLGDIAHKLNLSFEPATPKSYIEPLLPPDQTWDDVTRLGGLWRDNAAPAPPVKFISEKLEWADAQSSGDPKQFPFAFQPYLSLQYHDGSGANLPWMQELPDPVSSAMWDLPVEIDPRTAAQMNIETGDWVRVESPHGKLEAAAYVHPAAIPGVISMAIGEGHTRYGRFASGRGANPLAILAATREVSTGILATGATRVRIAKLDRKPRELIQFSPHDREQGPWGYR